MERAAVTYEPVIGLEVHAELLTASKMFCACAVVDPTTAAPNTSVCEVCTGMPGTLPVINIRAVEHALRVALALECTVSDTSQFARKNYFYPDLPKGYQISQYELPLAHDGRLTIDAGSGPKVVRIRRVHLEEDTGKLIHREGYTLVDYNRSGVPLLEIVSEPDLHSLDEVRSFSMALRSILRYLAASSGDMEKGAIRFEANVSVRPEGSTLLGTRTEIKNLNSFRSMVHAVTCEIERQSRVRAEGGEVWQETVGWDEARSVTFSQRGKEEADDYRYFPEPDLPPLVVDRSWVGRLRTGLPELPDAKRLRFQVQHGLTPYLAGVLTADRTVADYFEEALLAAPELRPEKIANWVAGDLFGLLNQAGLDITASKVRPAMLAELVGLVESGEVNSASAKVALGVSFAKGTPPRQVVHEQRLGQLSDRAEIDRLVSTVLGQNPEQVRQYLAGKRTIAQWLFGQVMRAGGGRANPALVQDQLTAALVALEQRPPDL